MADSTQAHRTDDAHTAAEMSPGGVQPTSALAWGEPGRLPRGVWAGLLAWSPVTVAAAAVCCAVALAAFPERILGVRPAPFEGEIQLRCRNPECGKMTCWFALDHPEPPRVCQKCGVGQLEFPMTCWNCGLKFSTTEPMNAKCPGCGSQDVSVRGLLAARFSRPGSTARGERAPPEAPQSPSER